VLKWIVERLEGTAGAVETPIGYAPASGSLDIAGLDVSDADLAAALAVDVEEWRAELPLIEDWFASIGDKIPTELLTELDVLRGRLGG
jgi:phosphoenolpyruvate carboxykinase (GTP)